MRKTIPTLGVVSAGLLLAGSPAQAVETDMSSNLNVGIANGIQAHLPIQAPINLCGNAIGLLGSANAGCVGGANANYASGRVLPFPLPFPQHGGYGRPNPAFSQLRSYYGGGGGDTNMQSALNIGIANGIQLDTKVQAPINICGNAIGILGSANASCIQSGANANLFSPGNPGTNTANNPLNRPIAQPAQFTAPVQQTAKPTPIKTTAVKSTPANRGTAAKPGKKAKKTEAGLLANLLAPVTGLLTGGERGGFGGWQGDRCGDTDMSTFGNVGIANGIQAHAPIQIPVNLAGNAIGLAGSANAFSDGGANANYCS